MHAPDLLLFDIFADKHHVITNTSNFYQLFKKGFDFMFKKRFVCITVTSMLLALSSPITTYAANSQASSPCITQTISESSMASKSLSINKKSWYRAEFKLVASAGNALGYTYAAKLLRNSLNDSPMSIYYGPDSDFVLKLKSTQEYQALIHDIRNILETFSGTSYTKSGFITINSNKDLKLAVHGMIYTLNADLRNDIWTISLQFNDMYDFDKMAWSDSGIKENLITFINNNAYAAQECGAIVSYPITVNTSEIYTVSSQK